MTEAGAKVYFISAEWSAPTSTLWRTASSPYRPWWRIILCLGCFGFFGLALNLPFISAWGLGGVFSVRNRTSSSRLGDMDWLRIQKIIPFSGVFNKIEYARKRLTELAAQRQPYLKSLELSIYHDPEPEDLLAVTIRAKQNVPAEMCNLAVEIAYHMRFSLDQKLAAISAP